MPVDMQGKSFTLSEFIDGGVRASGKGDQFWVYNAKTNNCQYAVIDLLKGQGLLTPELHRFIFQDSVELLKNTGVLSGVFKRITDFAAKARVLIWGGGDDQSESPS